MNFNDFLKNLVNPEKTRNFNIFKNYSLNEFEKGLKSVGLHRKFSKKKIPLRISVVGTNGKGSLAFFLSDSARRSGVFKKVGLYTSPHLLKKEERIKLNGKNISAKKLDSIFKILYDRFFRFLRNFSYFEIFTILAFYHFQTEGCDLEIYEAGLGGRLDATKTAFADIVVLTKIGLDHSEILGKTKEKILKEKLAISTEFTKYLFCYDQNDAKLNKIIFNYCQKNKIKYVFFPDKFTNIDYLAYNMNFAEFILNFIFSNIFTIKKTKPFSPRPENLSIRGRMEILNKNPIILFDVAHNVSALEYLLKSICNKYNFSSYSVMFACLKDKDSEGMLQLLLNEMSIDKIYLYSSKEFSNPKVENSKIEVLDETSLVKFFDRVKKPLVITGSSRLYAEIKKTLRTKVNEF